MTATMNGQGAEKWCGAFVFWRTPSGKMLRDMLKADAHTAPLLPPMKDGKAAIKSALYAQFPVGGEYSIRKSTASGQWEVFALHNGQPEHIGTVERDTYEADLMVFPGLTVSLATTSNEDASVFDEKIKKAVLVAKENMLSVSCGAISKRLVALLVDAWKGVHTTGVGVYIPEANREDVQADLKMTFKKLGWAENIFSLPVADVDSARKAAAEVIARSMGGDLHLLIEDMKTLKSVKETSARAASAKALLARATEIGTILQVDLASIVCALQAVATAEDADAAEVVE